MHTSVLAADRFSNREIYALLLQECSDEQRFQTTSKLCEDVLGAVADGIIPLADAGGVLGDALHILARYISATESHCTDRNRS